MAWYSTCFTLIQCCGQLYTSILHDVVWGGRSNTAVLEHAALECLVNIQLHQAKLRGRRVGDSPDQEDGGRRKFGRLLSGFVERHRCALAAKDATPQAQPGSGRSKISGTPIQDLPWIEESLAPPSLHQPIYLLQFS